MYEAPVTSVRAVVGPPEQRCWVEQQQSTSVATTQCPGAIAGAVIGGILGHQVGSGRGRDVATGVGALAGGAVGANVGSQYGGQSRHAGRAALRVHASNSACPTTTT